MGIDIKVIPDHNVLLQLLATLVLFLVMRAKLFKPIQKLLNDRKAYIRSNIEESENKKEEAANMQNEYEEQLKQAKIEAREIVAEAKKRRDEIVSKAETEAKEEASRIYEKNEKSMELERKRIFQEIQGDVADMALLAAGKVISENMDTDANRQLVNKFILKVEDGAWKN